MKFALYIIALLSVTQIYAQGFSDSALMDQGIQQPRNEVVVYNNKPNLKSNKLLESKYMSLMEDWSHPSGNQLAFESKFTFPFSWIGRQTYLRVRGASSSYKLMVNGVEVAEVQNGASPAEFNITQATIEGRNIVTITLDEEPKAATIEGWRGPSTKSIGEVYVVSQPTQMVRDVSTETTMLGSNLQAKVILTVKSHAINPRTSTIHYTLYDATGDIVTFGSRDITQSMRGEESFSFTTTIPKSQGWSAENPYRFTLNISTQHDGRHLEYQSYSLGFKSIDVDAQSGAMSINGSPVELVAKGVDAGFDPSQIAELKSSGFNAIRIGAGPQSRELYESCDREGLYIISPMPINSSTASGEITVGGNPTNDPRWWGAYMQRVDVGYHSVKLHPSVIAFSLADSSLNGYNLYEGYLRLKQMGDSRPVVYFESGGEWNNDNLKIDLKL